MSLYVTDARVHRCPRPETAQFKTAERMRRIRRIPEFGAYRKLQDSKNIWKTTLNIRGLIASDIYEHRYLKITKKSLFICLDAKITLTVAKKKRSLRVYFMSNLIIRMHWCRCRKLYSKALTGLHTASIYVLTTWGLNN